MTTTGQTLTVAGSIFVDNATEEGEKSDVALQPCWAPDLVTTPTLFDSNFDTPLFYFSVLPNAELGVPVSATVAAPTGSTTQVGVCIYYNNATDFGINGDTGWVQAYVQQSTP